MYPSKNENKNNNNNNNNDKQRAPKPVGHTSSRVDRGVEGKSLLIPKNITMTATLSNYSSFKKLIMFN